MIEAISETRGMSINLYCSTRELSPSIYFIMGLACTSSLKFLLTVASRKDWGMRIVAHVKAKVKVKSRRAWCNVTSEKGIKLQLQYEHTDITPLF